jgi:hypothetical protein
MKMQLISIAGAVSALLATPAMAQEAASTPTEFTGARAGITFGTGGNKFLDGDAQTMGLELGYDWDLGSAVAGVGVEYQTDLGEFIFDINETALIGRVGAKVGSKVLLYVNGGISVLNSGSTPFSGVSEEGVRGGAGIEIAGSEGAQFKIEQRYYDYGNGAHSWQTVGGVGFRF